MGAAMYRISVQIVVFSKRRIYVEMKRIFGLVMGIAMVLFMVG